MGSDFQVQILFLGKLRAGHRKEEGGLRLGYFRSYSQL